MTDTTSTQEGSGAATPASNETQGNPVPPPKSDAEAAQREEAAKNAGEQQGATKPDDGKKPNRTREYIDKLHRERSELQRELAQLKSGQAAPQQSNASAQRGQPSPQGDAEPTLEEHDFDVAAYTRAHSAWAVRTELQKQQTQQTATAAATQQQERWDSYMTRAAEFADEHPDFFEAVALIAYPLSQEIQDAVASHENGPAIAYHLANNDDDAFQLASIQPHLAAAAVERLAKRLSAAPAKPEANQPTQQPNNLAAATALAASQTKPISQAPPPAPTVGGRSPTDVPPEKLTDDQWFARERERERKR